MKKAMSLFIRVFAVGGLIGTVLAAWLAPKIINWYATGVEVPINCSSAISWGIARLQLAQLIGLIAGGIVSLALYYLVFKKKEDDPNLLPPL